MSDYTLLGGLSTERKQCQPDKRKAEMPVLGEKSFSRNEEPDKR